MNNLKPFLLKIFNQDVEIDYITGDETRFSSCINGLSKDSKPDCEIVDSFKDKSKEIKWYLVKVEEYLMSLRICKADENADYDEYCVVDFKDNVKSGFEKRKRLYQ